MAVIIASTDAAKQQAAKNEFARTKADGALSTIDDDIALIDGGPTNAELQQILRRCLLRQRKIIQYLKAELG